MAIVHLFVEASLRFVLPEDYGPTPREREREREREGVDPCHARYCWVAFDELFAFAASRPLARALLLEWRAGIDFLPVDSKRPASAVRKMVSEARRNGIAKLCLKSGGDLEQIKFLLGHSSIQITERYRGSVQDI